MKNTEVNLMHIFRKGLQILILLCVFAGVGMRFYFGTGSFVDMVQSFSFYTIQTNVLAGLGIGYIFVSEFSSKLSSRKYREIISLSISVWIFITFTVYHFFLSPFWFPSGIMGVVNILLHYATPILVIIHFLIGRKVLFKGVFFWILYPFLYTAFSLIRGGISGFYPYWFLSPQPIPDGMGSMWFVLLFILGTVLVYLLIGNILYLIKKERYKNSELKATPSYRSGILKKWDEVNTGEFNLNAKSESVAVFYFTGTGNTRWVAGTIEEVFIKRGTNIKTYDIETLDVEKANDIIKNSDICGFGYPVYGSDLPQLMKDFISNIDNVEGKKAFVFCTQWLWSGDGAAEGKRHLKVKGFKCLWGEHFSMPNNICITKSNILPFTNKPKKINRYLERNIKKCNRFVSIILTGERYFKGSDFLSYLTGYYFQRVYYKNYFARLQNDIGFDNTRCTKCGKCVNMCPVDNIVQDSGSGDMSALGNCILCVRCYNFCPESAITYRGKSYNTDRGIPYRGPKGLNK